MDPASDPRFPVLHETLVVLREIALVAPKLADSALLVSRAIHDLIPLAWAYLFVRVGEVLFRRGQ